MSESEEREEREGRMGGFAIIVFIVCTVLYTTVMLVTLPRVLGALERIAAAAESIAESKR